MTAQHVTAFEVDPQTGDMRLTLEGGEVLSVSSGTPAAVRVSAPSALMLHPRTAQARLLLISEHLAGALVASFPLAQAIREGQEARHDA